MELSVIRETTFDLPHADQFDYQIGSGTYADGKARFMRVSIVVAAEWFTPRVGWTRNLYAKGRVYNRAGHLTRGAVLEYITAGKLPPAVWVTIRDHVPAELHPGGTR